MAAILVPFRGAEGKRRLAPATPQARIALGLAMLADVLSACVAVAPTTLASDDEAAAHVAAEVGAGVVAGLPRGQGAAVALALARLDDAPVAVVNADLPCVVPDDLRELLRALPRGGIALAPAADGTTNALALADPRLFRPLYGPGSAERFLALPVRAVTVDHPNLADDVDTLDDLDILGLHVSPDLDSVLYALSGRNDEERGWGRAGETWHALETVGELGGETWFQLGDRDIGLHLVRTEALRRGEPLSAVTARLARALGVEATILPATDDPLRTWVATPAGEF